jgi:hypothetical protein
MHEPKALRPSGDSHAPSHAQACVAFCLATSSDHAQKSAAASAPPSQPGVCASCWQAVSTSLVEWNRSMQATRAAPDVAEATASRTRTGARIRSGP